MTNPRVPFSFTDDIVIPPPNGKPIIVSVVVNVESWDFNDSMPRKILSAPHGKESLPDIPNFSWAEYGLRAGMPRLIKIIKDKKIPASGFLNASIIDDYPLVAEEIKKANWEIVGHGMHQKSIQSENNESKLIKNCLDKLENFYGYRPIGWLGPGLRESMKTPDILKKEGIEYVCDWVIDDLPRWMNTKYGPIICMPYTLEINDSPMYAIQHQNSNDYFKRVKDTLTTFEKEIDKNPRILTIATHPHLIGVPHRVGAFEKILDELLYRNDTIFMTGKTISEWFRKHIKEG